jgi:hypothetical protein
VSRACSKLIGCSAGHQADPLFTGRTALSRGSSLEDSLTGEVSRCASYVHAVAEHKGTVLGPRVEQRQVPGAWSNGQRVPGAVCAAPSNSGANLVASSFVDDVLHELLDMEPVEDTLGLQGCIRSQPHVRGEHVDRDGLELGARWGRARRRTPRSCRRSCPGLAHTTRSCSARREPGERFGCQGAGELAGR